MTQAKTALIIGASRGLGLGLVQQLHADGWQVTASVRSQAGVEALQALPGVKIEQLDINDGAQVSALQQRLQGQVFDLLFINAGVSGPAHQSVEQATIEEIGQLFFTNAIAPIRLAQRFAPQVKSASGVLAFMSSVLGSVAIPEGNNMALYKASKAALNSMTNSFVCELEDSGLTVLSLHPGWVKTDMGGEGAPLDVQTSCKGLVEQINKQAGQGGHRFIDYQGTSIPW
ncbi:MAG: SDR family oxidoreductase [Pseudomonas sp.]|uniref:SDR family oxidoreductase n=1 Tax=Pseudomonas sp. TaxID=306 RepID=UPI0030EFED60